MSIVMTNRFIVTRPNTCNSIGEGKGNGGKGGGGDVKVKHAVDQFPTVSILIIDQ